MAHKLCCIYLLDQIYSTFHILEHSASDELAEHLTQDELAALAERVDVLLENPVFPEPSDDWPAVPWPAL